MTGDADLFGKKVELNLLRLHTRAPKAEIEVALEALRVENYHIWARMLDGMLEEVKGYWDKDAEKKAKPGRWMAGRTMLDVWREQSKL
ncbi:MAG: hypothetical protein Q9188_001738 [Gyalolechia gomerana]